MAENGKLWDPWKMYDASPEQLRAVKERAKVRQELKAEWTKKFSNPWKGAHPGGAIFDPAVQRYFALKSTQYEYYRGTAKSAAIAFMIFVVPISLVTYISYTRRLAYDRRIRNGEIKYKDRQEKFIY